MAKSVSKEPTPLDDGVQPTQETANLAMASATLLAWVRSLDPQWNARADAALSEHQWTPEQFVGACCAYVLEHGLHMSIPSHRVFMPGPGKQVGAPGECAACGATFKLRYAGQKFCHQSECETQRAHETPPENRVDVQ